MNDPLDRLRLLISEAFTARTVFEAIRGDRQTKDAWPERHEAWESAHKTEQAAVGELLRLIHGGRHPLVYDEI